MQDQLAADGVAALDRYDRTGDRSALHTADRLLGQVLTDRPAHPAAQDWCDRLSEALTDVAADTEEPVDYDRAIHWTDLLVSRYGLADPGRDQPLLRRAALIGDRAQEQLSSGTLDTGALAGLLAGPAPSGADLTIARYLRLLHGVALQMRAGVGPDGLDEAVAVLGPALDELCRAPVAEDGSVVTDVVDEDRMAMAAGALSEALRRRAARDENLSDLDRAVTVLQRAIRAHVTRPELRAALSAGLAFQFEQRWHARTLFGDQAGAAADLEAGLAACEAAEGMADPWLTGLRGELLSARAGQTGNLSDARAAVAILEGVAVEVADDPDGWRIWKSAAYANRLLTDDRDALATAVQQLGNALGYSLPVEESLRLHGDRVAAGQRLVQLGRRDVELGELVEAGIRALDAAPEAGLSERASVAMVLAFASVTATPYSDDLDLDRIGRLLALARRYPGSDDAWQAAVDTVSGLIEHTAMLRDPAARGANGLEWIAKALSAMDPASHEAQRLRVMLAYGGQAASGETGDLRIAQMARAQAGPDQPLPDPALPRPVRPINGDDALVLDAFLQVMQRLQAHDDAGAAATVREYLPKLESAGLTGTDLTLVAMMRSIAAVSDPLSSARLTLPALDPGFATATVLDRAAAVATVIAVLRQAHARDDVDEVRRCGDRFAEMFGAAGTDLRTKLSSALLAGQAYLEVALARRGEPGHAERAAAWFHLAKVRAGGVGFPMWPRIVMGLAAALRLAGTADLRETRELGLSALQGYAWQVFTQAGTDDAIASAKAAAADARVVAGWCLADRGAGPSAVEQLVAVLDASRALVLRATTTSRVIGERLDRAGRPDLAREWAATEGQGRDLVSGLAMTGVAAAADINEVPDDLRLRVLQALDGEDGVAGYEPITIAEIQDGLDAAGTQALVYLLAGEGGRPGIAVIVPVAGAPSVIELAGLRLGADSPVRAYLGTQRRVMRTRDLDVPAGVDEVGAPAAGLAELCGWAWDEVMQAVLCGLPDGATRIVLIPMGMLGVVPWHAATDRKQIPFRYAVQDVTISYGPSARSFCATAHRTRGAITSALIVGNPTGDLPFAGDEARAIHRAFYPDGSYVGLPASGAAAPGTPGDVLNWITSRPAGPAALHFACHGAADPRHPADARLVLAGPADLTARSLLERSQAASLDVQEVFLAACTTSVGGDDHDEVLSLASAFLAAGAATVIGSLWPVPDSDTSLLMFKIHQFLRVDGLAPADALHRAQLWMLDPSRDTGDLPPELRGHATAGTPFTPASWAGFIHAGR